jgi:hypothetical protein
MWFPGQKVRETAVKPKLVLFIALGSTVDLKWRDVMLLPEFE